MPGKPRTVSADELASMLVAASHVVEASGCEQSTELVWTGPTTPFVSARRTEQALLQVINAAKQTLVHHQLRGLRRLRHREGTESRERPRSGHFDAARVVPGSWWQRQHRCDWKDEVAGPQARLYAWREKADPFVDGSVHAKVAVADGTVFHHQRKPDGVCDGEEHGSRCALCIARDFWPDIEPIVISFEGRPAADPRWLAGLGASSFFLRNASHSDCREASCANSSVSPIGSASGTAMPRRSNVALIAWASSIGVQGFSFQQHRQIEVVLQAAVGHAQQGRWRGAFPRRRCRSGRPAAVVRASHRAAPDRPNQRAGCDGIAEADVDLRLAACLGQFARDDHADAAVARFLADLLDRDRGWVEHDAVVHSDGGDVPEYLGHGRPDRWHRSPAGRRRAWPGAACRTRA
jgi:hypothetical protein